LDLTEQNRRIWVEPAHAGSHQRERAPGEIGSNSSLFSSIPDLLRRYSRSDRSSDSREPAPHKSVQMQDWLRQSVVPGDGPTSRCRG
jgi:hypothetical protein